MRSLCVPALVAALVLTVLAPLLAQDGPELWLHLFFSVNSEEGRDRALDLLDRAGEAGYTHALLADNALNDLDTLSPDYTARLAAVQAKAAEVGIELAPGVMNIGYSGAIIGRNRNLDEGMPVRDAVFVVDGGEARLRPDPPLAVPDPGFENATDHAFKEWEWQDRAGVITFRDTEVAHSGASSLRMSDIGSGDPEYGHGRIMARLPVAPFRQYHVSVWVRTEEFDTGCMARMYIASPDGRSLSFGDLRLQATEDWTRHDTVFNSLDSEEILFYLGVWEGKSGSIWWDDLVIEEVGLVNVLRRDGTPLQVRGADGALYEEGVDFEPVAGMNEGIARWYPWSEEFPKAQPLRITAESRISEGERLYVSFYHAAHVLGDQTMCCLSEPEVYAVLESQIRGVQEYLAPRTWFMNHDEIRVANWCEACQSRGMTPGELLADNVRRCQEMILRASPGARIVVWSDMFDPNHNAHDDYYAVNGTWAGSWEGLRPTTDIANWYRGGGLETMGWFADRGHRQILCGYYDTSDFYTDEWLADAQGAGIRGIMGAMYTTWVPSYDLIEAWAEMVRGAW